ncbi:Xanthine dehydrogenase, molybdenum binding subunit [hydrothermal vent metagenome]|uniref:Xanthine dehydrogenase, molybdenum binding subunit n=1 Tax=hydrothermal vent metagenome TaxID=652676 RepID=A0A3B0TSX3_9ZZZZ
MLAAAVVEALSMAVASVANYEICPKLATPVTPERVLLAVDRLAEGKSDQW